MNTLALLSDAKYFDENNAKFDDVRALLESNQEKDKLEGMKRLMALMTLGRDVSSFFPSVVKNVIVESMEVKKLVYMYLVAHSEDNQQLALLSINTLQRDFTHGTQRVRSNAMRAMSSLRIPVVIPIITRSLKTAVKDNSTYVKRAASSSIAKIFSICPDEQDSLIGMVAQLLTSTSPEVLSSVMFAYQQICPDRRDLLHPHYRKICHLLADFTEWGQVVALDILLRYGRQEFLSPFNDNDNNMNDEKKKKKKSSSFYSDDDSDKSSSSSSSEEDDTTDEPVMSKDHELLLKQAELLIYSPNGAVVLGVTKLYLNLAPSNYLYKVVKPLCRMVRNRKEISYILCMNISTIASTYPHLFRPHINDFFIQSAEPLYVRKLKLDILATIVSEGSIHSVLKEFEAYCDDPDKKFVAIVIDSIGRCAQEMPEVAEKCMDLLMRLVSNSHTESVVAGSVVVLRQLLQSYSENHKNVIKRLSKMLSTTKIPTARAAIVWIIGEYRHEIPKIAPDALRQMAITFRDEEIAVKMQVLNLAVKLFLSNPKQTSKLFKYIMDLCKFDVNYDLRDRSRFLRALFFKKKIKTEEDLGGVEVKSFIKNILLSSKPAPRVEKPYSHHSKYLIGTMSHLVGHNTLQYNDLPDFPTIDNLPDPSTREPEETDNSNSKYTGSSSSSSSSDSDSDSSDSFFSSDNTSSSSDSSDSSDTDSSTSESDTSIKKRRRITNKTNNKLSNKNKNNKDEEYSSLDEVESSDSSDSDSSDPSRTRPRRKSAIKRGARPSPKPKKTIKKTTAIDDNILDIFMSSTNSNENNNENNNEKNNAVDDIFSNVNNNQNNNTYVGVNMPREGLSGELLNKANAKGLSIQFKFSRSISLYYPDMNMIILDIINTGTTEFKNIKIENINNIKLQPFDDIPELKANQRLSTKIHVDFNNKLDPIKFNIISDHNISFPCKLTPNAGELIRSDIISNDDFMKEQKRLCGMQERDGKFICKSDIKIVVQSVINHINVHPLSEEEKNIVRFSGCLNKNKKILIELVLTVKDNNTSTCNAKVNCDDFMFSGHIMDILKQSLKP